jgi:hypothetical protein
MVASRDATFSILVADEYSKTKTLKISGKPKGYRVDAGCPGAFINP